MKGASTFIATVLLVIATITIGLGVYWWYKSTISPVLEKTGGSAQSQALCSLASIRMLREILIVILMGI